MTEISVDSLGNISYYTPYTPPTPPSHTGHIIDTFTGENEVGSNFHPGIRQCEYTMLLDLQEILAQEGKNTLPRATK